MIAGFKAKKNDFKATYYEKAYKEGVASEQAAIQAQAKSELASKTLERKIGVVCHNKEESTADTSKYSNEIHNLNAKVINGELSPQAAKSHLEYYPALWTLAIKTPVEQVKELQTLSGSNDPEIFKSDFSELFNNLTEILRDYLSIFSSEQLAILFNLSGYMFIVMLLTTITLLLIGDDLINYFQVELKYPKIAKYIQFQLRLRQYSLRFYIVYLYFVILIIQKNIK